MAGIMADADDVIRKGDHDNKIVEAPQHCPHCGARLDADESFCPDCGVSLVGEAVVKSPHPKRKGNNSEKTGSEKTIHPTSGGGKAVRRPGGAHLKTTSGDFFSGPILALLVIVTLLIGFNQYQIMGLTGMLSPTGRATGGEGKKGLDSIDLASLTSTGHTVAAVFDVEDIVTSEDAMAIMFPTGTPEYGAALGVSFDDAVGSLSTLSRMYRTLKADVEANNPEAFQRFLSLASKPVGISCEYCCGVGPIGIDRNGNSACGCQHNPALLAVGLWLTANTDYSDGEVLREVMRWKTLFFPQKMIELGMTVAGGDTSALADLPGMVGGC